MKMINYDFYDLHAVIVCIRTKPENKTIIPTLNELVLVLNAPQSSNGIESNIVRKVIRNCHSDDIEYLSFAKTDNVYTAGVRIMKSEVNYRILSKLFEELILSLETDIERTKTASDCFHNIPIILADEPRPKKRICAEIKEYCKKYNFGFLKEELKLL